MLKTKEEIANWLDKYGIERYYIKDDLTVDVAGSVDISHKKLKEIPFQFGEVSGFFKCNGNELTSCKGFPLIISEYLNCGMNKIVSLEGCTQSVANFNCNFNKLTSLIGAPQDCNDSFSCIDNKLITLEGCPEFVGSFDCRHNELTSLTGGPKLVTSSFDCSNNKLTSLDGLPESVGSHIVCHFNPIKTLSNFSTKFNQKFVHLVYDYNDLIPGYEDHYYETSYGGEQCFAINMNQEELDKVIRYIELKNKVPDITINDSLLRKPKI